MPIIEGEPRGKHSPIKFEIDTETRELLRLYCKFSNNKKLDRVIIGALKHLFKTDTEFGSWLERHRSPSVRGANAPATTEEPIGVPTAPAGATRAVGTQESTKR
jgi:hypothetical protein